MDHPVAATAVPRACNEGAGCTSYPVDEASVWRMAPLGAVARTGSLVAGEALCRRAAQTPEHE
jgi:hypothetical protein